MWYAYFTLHKLHWEPSRFASLPFREKCLVMAMIDQRLEEEKKANAKVKRGGKRR